MRKPSSGARQNPIDRGKSARKKKEGLEGEAFLLGGVIDRVRVRSAAHWVIDYATSVKLMRVTMPAKIAAGMTPTQILPYLRYR